MKPSNPNACWRDAYNVILGVTLVIMACSVSVLMAASNSAKARYDEKCRALGGVPYYGDHSRLCLRPGIVIEVP